MSQQAAAGRGAGRGGGRKPRYFPRKGGGNFTATAKAYESPITEIAKYTFNMGENKFAAQFTESRERVAGYIQRSGMEESYLVAETIRTGTVQTIALPAPVDADAADKADLEVIRVEVVKSVAKRRQKLEESLKKGYATVYDQCSQEVRDKLKATRDWETLRAMQSLDELIRRIEKICVGFDDHKQSVFNLVQSLKTLFLHTQSEKETVEEYARNFRSLWDMVEAFGGSPGIQQGLVQAELKRKGLTNPTDDQIEAAEDVSVEQVKAALLISGADRRKFGRLKDELANNYLLGTDQYPDTLEKAGRILSNYQSTNVNAPFFRGQGGELPDNRVYLDGCSTVTAFKNDKFLKSIKTEARGVKINCNAGAISTNKRGKYGNLKVWYLPDGIANIISMHELESLYRITYDSWKGYYVVHTPKGEVRFYKDEQGLPYLDLEGTNEAGALLLMQHAGGTRDENEGITRDEDEGISLVQTVRGNY